jgi:DNA-binding NtrC family response regulator
MFETVYVLEDDAVERRWIESALTDQARALVFLDDGATLSRRLAEHGGDCLVCGAEPDAAAVLELVRGLRRQGHGLPVVVVGPHSAFRMAVELARLADTDFLQRPVSAQRLRGALQRLTRPAAEAAKG